MKNKQVGIDNNFKILRESHTDLGISDLYDISKRILKYVYDNELHTGRSKTALISGTIFASCRSENKPINPKDIADYFSLQKYTVLSSSKYISKNIPFVEDSPIKWESFLNDMCGNFDISSTAKNKAIDIGLNGKENGIMSGRSTRSYAVSTLYAATNLESVNEHITQSELSDYTGVSESTIREIYKKQLSVFKND